MLQSSNNTQALNFLTEEQIFAVAVPDTHVFRKLNTLLDFPNLVFPLRKLYSETGTSGIPVEQGFKALLIQFWEDYSDVELEKCLKENFAVRWFCGFSLHEDTPTESYFSKLRKRIGAENLATLFNQVNEVLRNKGLFGDTFTFIDASSIITKTKLWEERDRAIKDGLEKLNNAVVSNYTADTEAKWGAKSKSNIWFGYKLHTAVDMRFGLISGNKVTPANVPDFRVVADIAPKQGMVFMDKIYDVQKVREEVSGLGLHNGTIKKNNNKTKNRDLDRFLSQLRMPFEGTFSKLRKRAKYRGTLKVQFQATMQSLVHNLKKAMTILPR